jgi:hypothetical protein
VFTARPPAATTSAPATPTAGLALVRSVRRVFDGPAEFLADPDNRARIAEYVTDLAEAYGRKVPPDLFGERRSAELGQSYGEMAGSLIDSVVSNVEPVDLLILAFAVHDLRPGRQTAAYLSHRTPGAPMAFAICDQGSAAAFTGVRIAREYAASVGIQRALLIVVEQAALPYDCPVPLPAQHRGVAMLYAADPAPSTRLAGLRQHAAVAEEDVAAVAAADLADLTAGHGEVSLVLGDALAARWSAPAAARVRVVPAGQPSTGVWWELVDELDTVHKGYIVAAAYDAELRYLCLTAFDTGSDAA